MTAPFTVNPKIEARDVTFEFHDSCNCCCWEDKPNLQGRAYVDSKGLVQPFDPKKASDERESLKRSISHLQQIIANMAEEQAKDKEEVLKIIAERVTPLTPSDPKPMTFQMILDMLPFVGRKTS